MEGMMVPLVLLLIVTDPSVPVPAGPVTAPTPATVDEGVQLAAYFEAERRYAERLSQALGEDLSRHWKGYQDDEKERAEERAEGDDDDDSQVRSFAQYLDAKYRRRLTPGGILLGCGFAPLGFGLYIGLTLGEGRGAGLAMAGIGGAIIVTGAVLLGVRGAELTRLRRVQASLLGSPQARVRWRGVAPLYDPHRGTYGVGLGFAF